MSRPRTQRALLTGWGRTAATAADVVHAVHPDLVDDAMAAAVASAGDTTDRGLVARGMGRSYGDAAQNAGGTVVDATWLDAVHSVDLESGLVTVGGGISLQALMERFVPLGWFVPVTPGTRLVSVGGAIAADIHGKNHHVDGSFCSHVVSMTLVTPTGTHLVTPASDPALFWATAGGMGLTGIVTEATLQMIPVETSYMLVDTERATDLDDVMDKMLHGDDAYRYSVAWIDCQSTGSKLGRSVLTRGDHAAMADLPAKLSSNPDKARAFVPRQLARVPLTAPSGLLNPLTVGAFNEFWFRKAPKHQVGKPHHMTGFFHPLDGVGEWNRPRLSAVPVRGSRRRQRDGAPHHRAAHRDQAGLVLGRAQAVRPRRPWTALLPHARLDPRPRSSRRSRRTRPTAQRPRRAGPGRWRPHLPGQGLAAGPGHVPVHVPRGRSVPRGQAAGRPRRRTAVRPRTAPRAVRRHRTSAWYGSRSGTHTRQGDGSQTCSTPQDPGS